MDNSDRSTFMRVRKVLLGEMDESELRPQDKPKFDRWVALYGIIEKHGTNRGVVIRAYKRLMQDDDTERGLGDAFLYRQINFTLQLFGDVHVINRNVLRNLVIDSAYQEMMDMEAMLRKAKKDEEEGRAKPGHYLSMLQKIAPIKAKYQKNIIDAGGLSNHDPDVPDPAQLEKHEYTINIDGVALQILEGLKQLNPGNFMDGRKLFQDLDFEELEIANEDDNEEPG